jgi:hypothetical protein
MMDVRFMFLLAWCTASRAFSRTTEGARCSLAGWRDLARRGHKILSLSLWLFLGTTISKQPLPLFALAFPVSFIKTNKRIHNPWKVLILDFINDE